MIDASIALGVKPPQIDSPMNALAKVLQVREAQQGQQMNALKMDEYQRGITDQNALRQLISGFGTDRGANYQTLLKAGRLKEATDYNTTQDAAEKSQTEAITSNLKLFQSFAPQVKSPQDAAAYTRAMYNHPVLGKFAQQMGSLEDAMQRNADAFQKDPRGWLQSSAGVSADKLMEMMKKTRTNTNLGNVSRGESVDYFGEVDPKLTTTTPIEQSADSIASQATQRRGQNLKYETDKKANEVAGQAITSKKIQDVEMKLSDDYRTESKGFAETSSAMKKVLSAIETADKNPGSALAAGTAFMKILDPNSVVRETELGMALNASGWFDRATNYVNTLKNGRIMTKEQQKNLREAANALFEEAKASQMEIDGAYRRRATDYGANPDRVIVDRGQNKPAQKPIAALPPGVAAALAKHGAK